MGLKYVIFHALTLISQMEFCTRWNIEELQEFFMALNFDQKGVRCWEIKQRILCSLSLGAKLNKQKFRLISVDLI